MRTCGLSEKDWNRTVSDVHADEISRHYCKKWRSLYPHLELQKIVVTDAEIDYNTEEARRHDFITKWRDIKGSEATYKKLVCGLLKIDQKLDAENICRLLAKCNSPSQNAPNADTTPAGKITESSGCDNE